MGLTIASDVFLDTSYIVALSSADDEWHASASALARQLRLNRIRLVTTRAVLLEIGNALARQRFRQGAVKLLEAFETDPNVEVILLSERLYNEAFALYRARPDKEWGLVDCISFVVMQERGIYDALTGDDHYRQAGFRALLLDDI